MAILNPLRRFYPSGPMLPQGSQLNAMIDSINSAVQWPGNVYYVDPASAGNGVGSIDGPYNSLNSAYSRAMAGNNDITVLVGDGATTATARLTATLTWAKNASHLVGLTAPTLFGQRARISTLTGQATNINPLINVTGSGNIFANFSTFQGVGEAATDEKLIDISGSRNYFSNVAFGGMGHANGAARAGSYVIGLNGGGENLFDSCSIGLETIPRTAANASVKLLAASQRNDFINCVFDMYPTANSPLFVNANLANGLNGSTMMFRNCSFRALLAAAGGTQPAVNATVAADLNGNIYFDRCTTAAAKWAAATALVKVMGHAMAATTGFNSGVFANAADS